MALPNILAWAKEVKTKLCGERLNQAQKSDRQQLFLVANKLYKEAARGKGLVQVRVPRQPGKLDRELHGLTQHLTFRDWCDFWLSCKGRADPQEALNT